ncbi:MAG: uridylate kinase, partial [Clostridia bacterium]
MGALDLVVKIGSMALIQKSENAMDYNIFQRLGADLRPGMVLVTSGAAEIGRLDYMHRTGRELKGMTEQDKVDYSSQGQSILMH